jgi:hypothetical protein
LSRTNFSCYTKVEIYPFTKVRMSPKKGQESGQTSNHERKRNETAGSDQNDRREEDNPGAGISAIRDQHTASEAVIKGIIEKGGS